MKKIREMMRRMFGITLIFSVMLLTGCGEQTGLQDGYYTAQASEFSHGWKEYITIMVKGGNIVSVDNTYMQAMLHSAGTYPNEYTRFYASQLLDGQGDGEIDALTGATSSYGSFQKLAAAVIEQAKQGDSSIVIVDMAE